MGVCMGSELEIEKKIAAVSAKADSLIEGINSVDSTGSLIDNINTKILDFFNMTYPLKNYAEGGAAKTVEDAETIVRVSVKKRAKSLGLKAAKPPKCKNENAMIFSAEVKMHVKPADERDWDGGTLKTQKTAEKKPTEYAYGTEPGTIARELEQNIREYFEYRRYGIPASRLIDYYSPDHLIIGWERMDEQERSVAKLRDQKAYDSLSPREQGERREEDRLEWERAKRDGRAAKWFLEDSREGILFVLAGKGIYADRMAESSKVARDTVADIVQNSQTLSEIREWINTARSLIATDSREMRVAVGRALEAILSSPDTVRDRVVSELSYVFQDVGYVFWTLRAEQEYFKAIVSKDNVKPLETIVQELKVGMDGKSSEYTNYDHVSTFNNI